MALLFLATLLVLSQANLAPLLTVASAINDHYIVVYNDDISVQDFKDTISKLDHASQIKHVYQHALKGYSANLTAEQLTSVRQNPLVKLVEQDQVVRISACVAPVKVDSWGLTRISQQRMNLHGTFSYPTTAGAGATAYVIDTGIYIAHSQFGGRATFGFKADSSWSNDDKNGHGTHVTGTIIGSSYGIARQASAVAVKVLGDDGSGTNSGVIAGVDWVVGRAKKPSVINMSLGGGKSTVLDSAVNTAVDSGIVVAVAAGNSNADACTGSPSGASKVLSVGATDIGQSNTDVRSYFSNYGACTDIFAPGSDITSSWIGGVDAINTISGTSMASPHVAGVAVLKFADSPSSSATDIQNQILSTATSGIIDLLCSNTACRASANLMLYDGCDNKL